MNKYQTFQQEFTARHQDRVSVSAKWKLIVFCTVMFAVGFAFGYYISAREAATVVSTLTR